MSEFDLNVARQIFLVLFSILYGVMLQSLSGLQPFPLARLRRGFVGLNKSDYTILQRTEFWECQRVFMKEKKISCTDLINTHLNSYRTWLVGRWWWRFLGSFLLLSILPIGYFCGILFLLNDPYWSFMTLEGCIPQLVNQALNIGMIFWSALGVFGFYRLYHALFTWKWKTVFCDVTKKIEERGTSFDGWTHFIWGLGFYLIPPLLYLFIFNSCREFLWVWVVYILSFFLIHLFSSFDC